MRNGVCFATLDPINRDIMLGHILVKKKKTVGSVRMTDEDDGKGG